MDKRIANNIILGIFSLLGIILFLFLLFNMGGGQGFFSSQYTLHARFRHVKGLHQGSEVSLSGLRIGVIRTINVAPDGSKDLIADLSVNKKYRDQIREDSTARIATQGVLGDKYIEITIGSPEPPPLKDGASIPTIEVPDLFTKSDGLIEGISKHFEKGGDVGPLLQNLNRTAENLAAITGNIKTNLSNHKGILYEMTQGKSGESLNKSLAHLDGILKKIEDGEGSLGALINDPTVYEDIKTLLGGAKRSSILRYFMNQFREDGKAPAKK